MFSFSPDIELFAIKNDLIKDKKEALRRLELAVRAFIELRDKQNRLREALDDLMEMERYERS